MRELVGYCGLDCGLCDAHIATMNNDNELRIKTAKLWSELNQATITMTMINCMGCRMNGVKTPFCESMCRIRLCAKEKGFDTCRDCERMCDCEILSTVTNHSPEALANLIKG